MKSKNNKPINVALYGMDGRSHKTMVMFLQGPCKGIGVVVNELDAEVDIIDADSVKAKELMDDRKSKTPERPIILLSLEELFIEGTIYVKKPIQTDELVEALKKAKTMLNKEKPKKAQVLPEQEPIPEPKKEKKQAGTKTIDSEEGKKTSKHRTAMDLTEKGEKRVKTKHR